VTGLFRCFLPWVNTTLLVLGLVLTFLGMAYPWTVVALLRHERAALRQAVCAERLRALKAATPGIRHLVHPDDSCRALEIFHAGKPGRRDDQVVCGVGRCHRP
jgi:hypothetical protein